MGYSQENNKWDTAMPQHTPKISETTVELGSNTPEKKNDCIVLLYGGSGCKTSYSSAGNVNKGAIEEHYQNS